jgi:hypothetical protein
MASSDNTATNNNKDNVQSQTKWISNEAVRSLPPKARLNISLAACELIMASNYFQSIAELKIMKVGRKVWLLSNIF